MKKLITIITCALIMISGLFVMNDNQILAANLNDTYTEGNLTYQITDTGDTTHNGKVEIIEYVDTTTLVDLVIPDTVTIDNVNYDVVSVNDTAFTGASHVKSVHIPKYFNNIEVFDFNFIKLDDNDFTVKSSLKEITVDKDNPYLKVVNGVLYNMENGKERLALYPYASEATHYDVPDFLCSSKYVHVIEDIVFILPFLQNLSSVEMPFENVVEEAFTENGIIYRWNDANNPDAGVKVFGIPSAMKHPKFAKNMTNISLVKMTNYSLLNQALDFSFEDETYFKAVDGCIYEGNNLVLYPGGRAESVYRIAHGTEGIDGKYGGPFAANRNLKSLILPSTIQTANDYALGSFSLKSIMIEGTGNINWTERTLDDLNRQTNKIHVYVENGNTTVKQQMKRVLPHLTDEYFHEIGAVPTASITEVKTSLENKKDVKVTWNSDQSHTNYEVRRYDANGEYEVVASTTDTSFVDKTTAYNTTYKYEVIPYSLPVTSSQDSEDPLSTYHTFGTASAKSEIKTPVQTFQGTYVYKDADGKEVSITKTVEVGQSAVSHAPTIPTVTGYTFDKWTSDLTNMEAVDKDFTATATYKKIGSAGDSSDSDISIDSDDTNKPDTSDKPSGNDTNQPSDKKEETVITGDQTSILVPVVTLIIAGVFLVIALRKKKHH